jgi:pilus assembly protein CpaF
MFGKRTTSGPAGPASPPPAAAMVPRGMASAAVVRQLDPVRQPEPRRVAPVMQEIVRSEDFYQTKSMIFGALIEAIDLAQLAKLESDSAREEIRDIINEIISLKNVVLSIS